ncbi:hypothetical protein EIK77_005249 [Talaromyces pinophilus]|nr:hypothetical protein EIK77_005249 [Talaromyces pinophilus]
MNWETFYDERNLFLLDSNYAIVQQAFVPGSSQIPEQPMRVSNFVTAHQQINYATNVPENENVSREEATKAFKIRAINLLKTPKPELHNAVRALEEMTSFLVENSKPLIDLFFDMSEHIQQENRILWRLLNTCWLAVFQRQIESTRNDRRLNVAEMVAMGNFLIKVCDGIERHGLVDYEMGVWEEEILDRKTPISWNLRMLMNEIQVISRCIDKREAEKAADSGPPKA